MKRLPTKIVYTSRTHSQLKQVVSELRSTCYRPKVCVTASRDLACINVDLDEFTGRQKKSKCVEYQATKTCPYYDKAAKKMAVSIADQIIGSKEVADLEDVIKIGRQKKACPYYATVELTQQADLLVMPYSYLTTESVRRLFKTRMMNAVLIFDEAHNIEQHAEDGATLACFQ